MGAFLPLPMSGASQEYYSFSETIIDGRGCWFGIHVSEGTGSVTIAWDSIWGGYDLATTLIDPTGEEADFFFTGEGEDSGSSWMGGDVEEKGMLGMFDPMMEGEYQLFLELGGSEAFYGGQIFGTCDAPIYPLDMVQYRRSVLRGQQIWYDFNTNATDNNLTVSVSACRYPEEYFVQLVEPSGQVRSYTPLVTQEESFLFRESGFQQGTHSLVISRSGRTDDPWDNVTVLSNLDLSERPGPGSDVIAVLEPKANDILAVGQNTTIRWTCDGDVWPQVSIGLCRHGELVENITRLTQNDGQFEWRMPLCLTGDSGRDHEGQSDDFIIPITTPWPTYTVIVTSTNPETPPGTSCAFFVVDGQIEITSPSPMDVYYTRGTYDITWTNSGTIADEVDIYLYIGGMDGSYSWSSTNPIEYGVPNTGRFSWTVPSDFIPSYWGLVVQSHQNLLIMDRVDPVVFKFRGMIDGCVVKGALAEDHTEWYSLEIGSDLRPIDITMESGRESYVHIGLFDPFGHDLGDQSYAGEGLTTLYLEPVDPGTYLIRLTPSILRGDPNFTLTANYTLTEVVPATKAVSGTMSVSDTIFFEITVRDSWQPLLVNFTCDNEYHDMIADLYDAAGNRLGGGEIHFTTIAPFLEPVRMEGTYILAIHRYVYAHSAQEPSTNYTLQCNYPVKESTRLLSGNVTMGGPFFQTFGIKDIDRPLILGWRADPGNLSIYAYGPEGNLIYYDDDMRWEPFVYIPAIGGEYRIEVRWAGPPGTGPVGFQVWVSGEGERYVAPEPEPSGGVGYTSFALLAFLMVCLISFLFVRLRSMRRTEVVPSQAPK